MKKIFISTIIGSSFLLPFFASAQSVSSVLVTAKELRARTQPNTYSPSIVSIYTGEKVSVVEVVTGQIVEGNSTWYKTKSGYYVWSGGTAGGVSLPTTASAVANIATGNTTVNSTPSPWLVSGSNIYYNNGNVGIGKQPSYQLDVSGTLNAGQFCINGSNCISSWPSSNTNTNSSSGSSPWVQSGGNVYYNSGNVGVNITNPTSPLHIKGTGAYLVPVVQVDGGGLIVTGAATPTIGLYSTDSAGKKWEWYANISGLTNLSAGTGNIALYNRTDNTAPFSIQNGNVDGVLNINGANVGIGTRNPSQKLDVSGSVQANDFYANNQQGLTKIINVTQGAGTCSLNFTGGILTSTNCQ